MIHLLRVEVTGVDWSNLTAQEDWALLGATSVWQKQQKTCPTGWKYLWSCGAAHRAGNADGKALGCREPSHSVPQPRLCCTWMLPPRMAGSPQVPHGPAAPLGAAHHPAVPAGGWGLGCGMGVQLHGGYGRRMEPGSPWGAELQDQRQRVGDGNRTFHLNMRRTLWVAGAWNRLLGGVVESPSLQALRILVDTILISVLEGTLSSKGADPTLTPLWVCLPLWCLQNCFFCPAPGLKSLGGAFQGWGPSAHPAGNTRVLPPGWARWWPCHINHHPPRNSMSFHVCFCGIHAPVLGYSFLEVPLAGMETALPWAVAMEVNKRSGKARKYTVKASKMIKNDYTQKRGKQQGKNLEQIQQRQLASAELQPCLLFFTWQSFLCM